MSTRNELCAIALFSVVLLVAIPISEGYNVAGSILNTKVSPGENFDFTMNVSLTENETPIDISAELFGLGQHLDQSNSHLTADEDSPYSARPFLSVSPTSFHLDPGQWQIVTLMGSVPEDIGDGGRYAVVYIHPDIKDTKGSGVRVIKAYDIPVILTISDTELVMTGEITGLDVNEPVSASQQNISLVYKNTGNYHYKAQAKADLKDESGIVLATALTDLSGDSILPTFSKEYKFKVNPDNELEPGTYYIEATVTLEDGSILATKEVSFEVE